MLPIRCFLFLSLLSVSHFVFSASVIYEYNNKGETSGILGISGITQESSWRCKNDPSVLCSCPTIVLIGTIAQIDYHQGTNIAENFVLETSNGSESLTLVQDWDVDLGTADSSWISRLLRKNEKVFVVAESCGAGGRNLIVRDIFGSKMFIHAISDRY